MARKANKQNRSKQRKFREAKKKMQQIKLQADTRIPKKQHNRWATVVTPLASDLVETERDPDYVAFCIAKQMDAWDELALMWLRIAAALRLGTYTTKAIDRTGRLRPFDRDIFSESISNQDYENEVGLRYEADKFLCYLLYGDNVRFREMFAYVLLPTIKNDLATDLDMQEYFQWVSKDPTADLCKRLAEFDLAKVE